MLEKVLTSGSDSKPEWAQIEAVVGTHNQHRSCGFGRGTRVALVGNFFRSRWLNMVPEMDRSRSAPGPMSAQNVNAKLRHPRFGVLTRSRNLDGSSVNGGLDINSGSRIFSDLTPLLPRCRGIRMPTARGTAVGHEIHGPISRYKSPPRLKQLLSAFEELKPYVEDVL